MENLLDNQTSSLPNWQLKRLEKEKQAQQRQLKNENKRYQCPYCNKKYDVKTHITTVENRIAIIEEQPGLLKMAHDIFSSGSQHVFNNPAALAESRMFNQLFEIYMYMLDKSPNLMVEYVTWLMDRKIPHNKWLSDDVYFTFCKFINQHQSVENSIFRSIEYMQSVGKLHNIRWQEYLKLAPVSMLVFDLSNARISPWMMFASSWGKAKLRQFSDEQLQLAFDSEIWDMKVADEPESLKFATNMIINKNII